MCLYKPGSSALFGHPRCDLSIWLFIELILRCYWDATKRSKTLTLSKGGYMTLLEWRWKSIIKHAEVLVLILDTTVPTGFSCSAMVSGTGHAYNLSCPCLRLSWKSNRVVFTQANGIDSCKITKRCCICRKQRVVSLQRYTGVPVHRDIFCHDTNIIYWTSYRDIYDTFTYASTNMRKQSSISAHPPSAL